MTEQWTSDDYGSVADQEANFRKAEATCTYDVQMARMTGTGGRESSLQTARDPFSRVCTRSCKPMRPAGVIPICSRVAWELRATACTMWKETDVSYSKLGALRKTMTRRQLCLHPTVFDTAVARGRFQKGPGIEAARRA